MTTFTFTTRETYIEYRNTWKERYAATSNNQRKLKRDIVKGMKDKISTATLQWALISGTIEANNMLDELKEAKKEAQRQYLASKV